MIGYPNRPQWVSIWITVLFAVAALGHGQRRVAAAYLLVGGLRTWQQAKSPARKWLAVVGCGVVTALMLLVTAVLMNPKA